ncbi:hypothetical protein [Streptomyces sp. NPDC050564]|uniref:hypothetical protein n=1 Tax=Streptomyces sp. NPDC050564 TaxID=3365631 RepID=UPI0037A22BF0
MRAFEEGLVATQPGAAPERERGVQATWPEAAAVKGDAEPALVCRKRRSERWVNPRLFIQATSEVRLRSTCSGGKGCIVWFQAPVSQHRKSANMVEILAAVATKIAVALAEAIILRLAWELWAAYSRSLRPAFIPAAA